jgi:PAS domain-containing protein
MQASGDGFWEVDLADGCAWFSDWFCARVRWTRPKHPSWSDFRPLMSHETWHVLLRSMRSHLEERTPLDIKFQVQLAEGRSEWWQLHGSAQRGDFGHPTHFAGCMRDVTASRANPKMGQD